MKKLIISSAFFLGVSTCLLSYPQTLVAMELEEKGSGSVRVSPTGDREDRASEPPQRSTSILVVLDPSLRKRLDSMPPFSTGPYMSLLIAAPYPFCGWFCDQNPIRRVANSPHGGCDIDLASAKVVFGPNLMTKVRESGLIGKPITLSPGMMARTEFNEKSSWESKPITLQEEDLDKPLAQAIAERVKGILFITETNAYILPEDCDALTRATRE